jgi:hypothetical protein
MVAVGHTRLEKILCAATYLFRPKAAFPCRFLLIGEA